MQLKEPVQYNQRLVHCFTYIVRKHFIVPWKGIGDYGVLYKIMDHRNGKHRDPNCGINNDNWTNLIECLQKARLNLKERIQHLLNGSAHTVDLRGIPSILNIDSVDELRKEVNQKGGIDSFLKERNLHRYTIGNEVMHLIAGHLKNVYTLLGKAKSFNQIEAKKKIDELLSRQSSASRWSFSDWRYVFFDYKNTLLPFIQSHTNAMEWMLFSLKEVQRGLYTKIEKWTEERKCATLVNILLHFISVLECLGPDVLKLHLHIISSHIPEDIIEMDNIPLSVIYAELCEQMFHFIKNIANNMSNHLRALMLNEFIVRIRLSRLVQPLYKKQYKSKTKISKLEEKEKCYEAVIPSEIANHEKYGEWVRMFRKKFLCKFENLCEEVNGNIVYKTGETHPLKNVSMFANNQFIVNSKRKPRVRCTCKNPKFILKNCGKCVNCCTKESCSAHTKARQRKAEKIAKVSNHIVTNQTVNSLFK